MNLVILLALLGMSFAGIFLQRSMMKGSERAPMPTWGLLTLFGLAVVLLTMGIRA